MVWFVTRWNKDVAYVAEVMTRFQDQNRPYVCGFWSSDVWVHPYIMLPGLPSGLTMFGLLAVSLLSSTQ